MTPIWSNGQGPMTFDTLPKVQVAKKYIIVAKYDQAFLRNWQIIVDNCQSQKINLHFL